MDCQSFAGETSELVRLKVYNGPPSNSLSMKLEESLRSTSL